MAFISTSGLRTKIGITSGLFNAGVHCLTAAGCDGVGAGRGGSEEGSNPPPCLRLECSSGCERGTLRGLSPLAGGSVLLAVGIVTLWPVSER